MTTKRLSLLLLFLALFFVNSNSKVKAQTAIGQKTVKVMVIDFDPILVNHSSVKLSVYKNWGDTSALESSFISDVKSLSGSYVNYQIVQRVNVNAFPVLNDGYTYNEASYLSCLSNSVNCHNPWLVNYLKILTDYGVCDKVNAGQVDELWLWGGPWFGYWEAVMTGPDPFSTNAPPLAGSTCSRALHIMGFSYERGLSEMLEDLGHRIEGTMVHVFTSKGINYWTNYTAHNACGSVHIPPNSTTDYDWSNTTPVQSKCENYLNYPNLSASAQTFGCERWGCTGLGWKEYWLRHIPKFATSTGGTSDNWWKYLFDNSTKAGDVNRDGSVNIIDIGLIIDDYGKSNPTNAGSDINGDGAVNIVDIGITIDNYGT